VLRPALVKVCGAGYCAALPQPQPHLQPEPQPFSDSTARAQRAACATPAAHAGGISADGEQCVHPAQAELASASEERDRLAPAVEEAKWKARQTERELETALLWCSDRRVLLHVCFRRVRLHGRHGCLAHGSMAQVTETQGRRCVLVGPISS
jgi:hypothetical protein